MEDLLAEIAFRQVVAQNGQAIVALLLVLVIATVILTNLGREGAR